MKGMLALVLDRATSAQVSRINYEIGHDVQLHPHYYKGQSFGRWRNFRNRDYDRALDEYQNLSDDERRKKLQGESTDYETLLKEYVELKLYLHTLRKSMYYPYDAYAEREGDFTEVLERCREIRSKIKALRGDCQSAVWGDFAPEPQPTVNDKPLLYAMDDHQCSYFAGLPYCRSHQGQARKDAKEQRRAKQQSARQRHRVAYMTGDYSCAPEKLSEPCTYKEFGEKFPCGRSYPHVHYGGRIERF
jgi:hypothetical protein